MGDWCMAHDLPAVTRLHMITCPEARRRPQSSGGFSTRRSPRISLRTCRWLVMCLNGIERNFVERPADG